MAAESRKKFLKLKLKRKRQKKIDELIIGWDFNQREFFFQRLNQHGTSVFRKAKKGLGFGRKGNFKYLNNPAIFLDEALRFEATGEWDPNRAWNKIISEELDEDEIIYFRHTLQKELDETYVPSNLRDLFEKIYSFHIKKEYVGDSSVPKAPILLVLGPTGAGKTATLEQVIKEVMIKGDIKVEEDFESELEDIYEKHPVSGRLFLKKIDPELAERKKKHEEISWAEKKGRSFFGRKWWKKEIGEILKRRDREKRDEGLEIKLRVIKPKDVQTMWYGETGNKLSEAFGPAEELSVVLVEEGHALFGKHKSHSAEVQEDTLVSTANIIFDEIIKGRRNCVLVCLTRRPEDFHEDIYRRFDERGAIIDITEYWRDKTNLENLIRIEANRYSTKTPELTEIADKIYQIFLEKSISITPAYVRKLVGSIIDIKKDLKTEYFDDMFLVREAFINVARNSYPEMFKKSYNKMEKNLGWDDYVGNIKNDYLMMVNNVLKYNISNERGVVLEGPPGSGKTFLVRICLSENQDISDVTIKMEHLQDTGDPVNGPIEKLSEAYEIAKLVSPTLVFIDEGDVIARKRDGSFIDKLTNKFLNIIDGENPLHHVYTTLTTNHLGIIDPALLRSKRLGVLTVSGYLNNREIDYILKQKLDDIPKINEVTYEKIRTIGKRVCNTPADYVDFAEKIRHLHFSEYKSIEMLRKIDKKDLEKFARDNFNTLSSIIENLESKKITDLESLIKNIDSIFTLIKDINCLEDYPLKTGHVEHAISEIKKSPFKKAGASLTEFLESEVSKEPQVGFVVGAGAGEVSGNLFPISSSLDPDKNSQEKIIVTGAVSSQHELLAKYVEMAKQSSREALSLVQNYLQTQAPELNMYRVMGEFLKDYVIHHQLLNPCYEGGGPSAGFALAINTLSLILNLPVRHDFGITGVPWSRGKSKKEVGSSVIIGGTELKADAVLYILNRMYVPEKNIKDFELDRLLNYWNQGKDIVAVTNFSEFVPEFYDFGEDHSRLFYEFVKKRIEYKKAGLVSEEEAKMLLKEIDGLKQDLRKTAESEIGRRIYCLKSYVSEGKDPYLSFDRIFQAN